jgi:hypothetical protein
LIRYLVTFVLVAVVTCLASLWWLRDGDGAAAPVLPQWDAPTLAQKAGVADDPVPSAAVAPDPAPDAEDAGTR